MNKKPALLALALFATGCIVPTASDFPTPFPADYLPTVVALTGQSAYATAFASTPVTSPTATLELATSTPADTPTPEPTSTPTPEPGFGEYAQIRFLSPGPMSKIVSPLQVQMLLVSGESELVQIDLLGEDGRKLSSKLERVRRQPLGVYRTLKIPFEFRAAAELGWLQVNTKDDQGRMQALNSLRVLLMTTGSNEINPPGNIIYERVVLETPRENQDASGGILDVSGRIWPMNTQPVFLDLVDSDGRVLATRVLTLDGLDPQYFETTIPYKTPQSSSLVTATPVLEIARLTIRQDDPELNIPIYVYTRLVHLRP